MTDFAFELLSESGSARRGRLRTPHGVIETPAFVAVFEGNAWPCVQKSTAVARSRTLPNT